MLVRWLPKAIAERNAQLLHIARNNLSAAIDQGDRIQIAANRLADVSEIGRPGRRRGTRELVIKGTPFLAVYRINGKAAEVQILRLLHGAQRWPPRKRSDR